MTVKDFVTTYWQSAIKCANTYTLPLPVILTQAGLESAWATSLYGNNFFGIKADSSWKGDKQLLWTYEYINGVKQRVQSYFRKYATAEESFMDYGAFIYGNARYKTARERYATYFNANEYIDLIAAAGYATAPNYASSLKATMKNVLSYLPSDYEDVKKKA
ncbi:MAG: glucosaminidase domain-containing protein [Prevotellaceae bacterium]|nr:glucosaminidase domain-containing protein [Prevotellaceae bacterium]